jgi:cyclophilin family peptidyl-prolyl cis-trans isomerase
MMRFAVALTAAAVESWDAVFRVAVKGGEETFTVRVNPEWAPIGAARFEEMVDKKVLEGARFFRVVPNFMVQFGIPGDPKEASYWSSKTIKDDPKSPDPDVSNTPGMVTFATAGPNTRTTQIFINYGNNKFLDGQGFTPFAQVADDGMRVVKRIEDKYREKPNQGLIQSQGNAYLDANFPDLSYVISVTKSKSSSELPDEPVSTKQTSMLGTLQAESTGGLIKIALFASGVLTLLLVRMARKNFMSARDVTE